MATSLTDPDEKSVTANLSLPDLNPQVLQVLCGAGNRVLHRIEKHFNVLLLGQPGNWHIEGEQASRAASVLQVLAERAETGHLADTDVEGLLRDSTADHIGDEIFSQDGLKLCAGHKVIEGKTRNQRSYLRSIHDNILTIAVGPAGTGKTYLAVAAAVVALESHQVGRIILTRPAVEAGERLGFLPGDLQQKVDPYLRPLYDALTDMLGVDRLLALMEADHIEVAPLAYMRGRTLNDAFIILDEAQNTTREQMKMFLTRLGFSSRMVVTGDITQIDLPQKHQSGLLQVLKVLSKAEEIGLCHLSANDVVRHPLVERIVSAYEKAEKN
ncbi:MAG: PhoH family protein [Mariprofundaceae bacterium]